MKNKKFLLRLAALLLLAVLLAAALAAFAVKAYSLYNNLKGRIDYTNTTAYDIQEMVKSVHHSINSEFASYSFDYGWLENTPPLVAHAFGGIDGDVYTNSLEAFERNYALGHRVFEVDLDLSSEYILVASHDRQFWREHSCADAQADYSYDNFMASRLYDRYTALDYRDVVNLLIRYPDIHIVLDTKYKDLHSVLLQFSQLVKYASSVNAGVLDRIIPQIYHPDMLRWVMTVHPFRSAIFTLYNYAYGRDPQVVFDFCRYSGIRYITIPDEWVTPEAIELWDRLEITVAAHTVNNPQRAEYLRNLGVDVIYTDFLTPDDL